ncbi:MAG: hypothetical protein ACKO7W_22930 [Elainella sp.]
MLLVQFAQDIVPHLLPHLANLSWVLEPIQGGHLSQLSQINAWDFGHWDLGSLTAAIQAQLQGQQFDTDVFKGARGIFNGFIKSGQLWAFLIGLIVGYLLRALTTYG